MAITTVGLSICTVSLAASDIFNSIQTDRIFQPFFAVSCKHTFLVLQTEYSTAYFTFQANGKEKFFVRDLANGVS